MYQIGIVILLTGLLFGVQCLPSRRNADGRSNTQLTGLNLKKNDLKQVHDHRESREIRMLRLNDPLDCLSQVICGLNTYPPQKPSVRSSTANDFAYLLKNSISKLRSQQQSTTTTTTVAPATKRSSTTKAPLDDDDEEDDEDYDDDTVENEVDTEEEDVEYESLPSPVGRRLRRGKRYSIFNKRRGEESKKSKKPKQKQSNKKGKSTGKKSKGSNNPNLKKAPPNKPRPLTALDRLRMETNLRAKLLSEARCVNGLVDHSCPFNYQQMLVMISSSLERERTVSYTSNKVLPMVGYLIKSRNYTGTLQATFTAIERINNYTIEADKEAKPIDFTHILDEIMNRVTPGDNGLRIVDTSNDSASVSVWEDDEFDHVLQHPYERKRPQSDNYKLAKKREQALKKKQKQKGSGSAEEAADDDQSTTSEEDTSEEGLVFDRPRPLPGPPGRPGDAESSSEEDDVNQDAKKKEEEKKKKNTVKDFNKQSLVPGPVFGFSHLQKSAEDE